MFANLIESASHKQDLARKGRFFIATLISYALIVACAGLASIYAYDAHVENQDLEFLGLVPPLVPETPAVVPTSAGPKAPKTRQQSTVAQRTVAIDRIDDPTKIPDAISTKGSSIPEIPKYGGYTIGPSNTDAIPGGPTGDGNSVGDGTAVNLVPIGATPPPRNETPAQPKKEMIKSGGVMNGQATFLPKPEYSAIAKSARASGTVNVQVLIDESGKVISARATLGNPLLRSSAVRAAYQSRFSPTFLSGVPVKVSGVINYNFSLQ